VPGSHRPRPPTHPASRPPRLRRRCRTRLLQHGPRGR
jgi:hypothetical protein